MHSNKILLVSSDPDLQATVRDALAGFEVEVAPNIDPALKFLKTVNPGLILMDYDLHGGEGLAVFRKMRMLAPRVKTIMFSSANDIPLAVSAAKLGAADFLRKPINGEQLARSVKSNLFAPQKNDLLFPSAKWLQGESGSLRRFLSEIKDAANKSATLGLVGGMGIEKKDVVDFVHSISPRKKRQKGFIDLSSFEREGQEAHFWAAIQEFMSVPQVKSIQGEEDRCGTLFLDKIEMLEDSFICSIINFLDKRSANVDSDLLVVIGLQEERSELKNQVKIPPLRDRKEDLPFLLGCALRKYNLKYNKMIKGFSAKALDLLNLYDYPGNYRELETIVLQAALSSQTEMIDIKDIPLDLLWLIGAAQKKALRSGKTSLLEARQIFEKELYLAVLERSDGDLSCAARFMDVPRTILAERLGLVR